jgi:hypothetical protein
MRRPTRLLIVAVGVVAGALAGYAVGGSHAPTSREAASEQRAAFKEAFPAARRLAYRDSYGRGRDRGAADGRIDGKNEGGTAGTADGATAAEKELAAIEAAEAAIVPTDTAPSVVCDGAIADDAHYAACLEQSGQSIPPGFPGGPAGCPSEPPFPLEGPCAGVRP